MTRAMDDRARRLRRSYLTGGVLALTALFVVGWLVKVPAIERDLEGRAVVALGDLGISARVDFDGQDATLRCAVPMARPDAARDAIAAIDGVHAVRLDRSCTEGGTPVTVPDTAPDTTPDTTVPDTEATTTTEPATTTTVASEPTFTARLDKGLLTVAGTVPTQAARDTLIFAASASVDVSNVTDRVEIGTVDMPDADVTRLISLVSTMSVPLVSGELTFTPGKGFALTGVYTTEAARDAFLAAAGADLDATLTARPTATAAQAAALQQALNDIVTATPIPFGKGAITVDPSASGIMNRLAGLAKQYAGVSIVVQGHTDSEGDPTRNLQLSKDRAQATMNALVALGVPADELRFDGFGETQLIRDENGREIPEKSRRVVFAVSLAT